MIYIDSDFKCHASNPDGTHIQGRYMDEKVPSEAEASVVLKMQACITVVPAAPELLSSEMREVRK